MALEGVACLTHSKLTFVQAANYVDISSPLSSKISVELS